MGERFTSNYEGVPMSRERSANAPILPEMSDELLESPDFSSSLDRLSALFQDLGYGTSNLESYGEVLLSRIEFGGALPEEIDAFVLKLEEMSGEEAQIKAFLHENKDEVEKALGLLVNGNRTEYEESMVRIIEKVSEYKALQSFKASTGLIDFSDHVVSVMLLKAKGAGIDQAGLAKILKNALPKSEVNKIKDERQLSIILSDVIQFAASKSMDIAKAYASLQVRFIEVSHTRDREGARLSKKQLRDSRRYEKELGNENPNTETLAVLRNNIALAGLELEKLRFQGELTLAARELALSYVVNSKASFAELSETVGLMLACDSIDNLEALVKDFDLAYPSGFAALKVREARLGLKRLSQREALDFAKSKELRIAREHARQGFFRDNDKLELAAHARSVFDDAEKLMMENVSALEVENAYFARFLSSGKNLRDLSEKERNEIAPRLAAYVENLKSHREIAGRVVGAGNEVQIFGGEDENVSKLVENAKAEIAEKGELLVYAYGFIHGNESDVQTAIASEAELSRTSMTDQLLNPEFQYFGEKMSAVVSPVMDAFADADQIPKMAYNLENRPQVAERMRLDMNSFFKDSLRLTAQLVNSIETARGELLTLRAELEQSATGLTSDVKSKLGSEWLSSLVKQYPGLAEVRRELMLKAVGKIDYLLDSPNSPMSEYKLAIIKEAHAELQDKATEHHDKQFYGVLAIAAVVAGAVVGGMYVAGLAAKGGLALFGGVVGGETISGIGAFAGLSAKYAGIANFSLAFLGMAAGATLGQNIAMDAIDVGGDISKQLMGRKHDLVNDFNASWKYDDLVDSFEQNLFWMGVAAGGARIAVGTFSRMAASTSTLFSGAGTAGIKALELGAHFASPAKWFSGASLARTASGKAIARTAARRTIAKGGAEIGEEYLETTTEINAGTFWGTVAAIFNSLDGININLDLAAMGVRARELGIRIVNGELAYDGDLDSFLGRVEAGFGTRALADVEVIQDANGDLILSVIADGSLSRSGTITIRKVDSVMAPDLVIDRVHGLEKLMGGGYRVNNAQDMMLATAQLEQEGFIITRNEDGSFEAKKGDISFKVEMAPGVKAEIKALVENVELALTDLVVRFQVLKADPNPRNKLAFNLALTAFFLTILGPSAAHAGIGEFIEENFNLETLKENGGNFMDYLISKGLKGVSLLFDVAAQGFASILKAAALTAVPLSGILVTAAKLWARSRNFFINLNFGDKPAAFIKDDLDIDDSRRLGQIMNALSSKFGSGMSIDRATQLRIEEINRKILDSLRDEINWFGKKAQSALDSLWGGVNKKEATVIIRDILSKSMALLELIKGGANTTDPNVVSYFDSIGGNLDKLFALKEVKNEFVRNILKRVGYGFLLGLAILLSAKTVAWTTGISGEMISPSDNESNEGADEEGGPSIPAECGTVETCRPDEAEGEAASAPNKTSSDAPSPLEVAEHQQAFFDDLNKVRDANKRENLRKRYDDANWEGRKQLRTELDNLIR